MEQNDRNKIIVAVGGLIIVLGVILFLVTFSLSNNTTSTPSTTPKASAGYKIITVDGLKCD